MRRRGCAMRRIDLKELPPELAEQVPLVELERTRPVPVPKTLIHGDLSLDNVLIDDQGALISSIGRTADPAIRAMTLPSRCERSPS